MAKQKGDANLNFLKKELDQIVGQLQTIQRNIASMREAGKSAKQIYSQYGKELEKLIDEENTLNDLIEERKELTKNEGDTYAKYVKLKKASDREQKKLVKELSDLEDKAYKRSEKSKQSGLKNEKRRQKETLKLKDRNYLQEIRGSNKTVRTKLRLELEYLNKIQRRYNKSSKEYLDIENQKTKALQKSLRDRDSLISKYRRTRPKEGTTTQQDEGFLGGFVGGLRGSQIGKNIGRLTGLGTVLTVFKKSLDLVRQALVSSFKAAVDYEAQLAQLQAVTGVSNAELQKLSDSVLEVAGSTTFTSEQIVELQTELGKLGFSSDEIIAATRGIAATAQALGESVGPVAQKVGQILKQYNLNASETEKISDTLVSTINSSALSFEGFGTALQYIGPLAAEVGTEFEETAAAMAVLADNGFTASRIGTGLRGILTELSSTGQDLTSVIRELADRNLSFSEAIDLVGKRNAAQLITLVDNVEALEKAEDRYYQAGSAAIASAQQIDTYKGNLQLLNSALNKVSISFGNLIKNSKILRLALRLVDEEGYNAALASEQLAEANRQSYSKALEDSAKYLAGIANKGKDVTDRLGFYTKVIIKRSIIDPLLAEAEALREERDNIANEMFGGPASNVFELEALAADERYKEIGERLQEIRNVLGSSVSENIELSETYEKLAEAIGVTKDQLIELIKQERIDLKRGDVSKEFTDDLKERRELRKGEFKDLQSAADFELANRAKVESFNARIDAAKKDLIGLSGDELELQQAVVDQLEQEQQNYVNLLYTKEELFEFAQKEYELEFKTLNNRIEQEKQNLDNKQKLLQLEIDTLQNQIEGTSDKEKQNELIAKQTELQNQLLENQEASYATVSEYINEQYDELEKTRKLWKKLGYDTRLLDKAFARLEDIRLGITELAIDFPELADAARSLADSFKKQFGDQLSKGKPLTDEQKEFINQQIDTLINEYGGLLSEEQKKALRENLLSGLFPDPSKDAEDTKKKYLDLARQIADGLKQAADAYNQTALENTKNRLDAELDAIKSRYKTEEDILKSQLDNQLITENQFRLKQKELRKAQLAEENSINKQIFEAEKKSDLQNVAAETLAALASNAINNFEKYDAITAGIITTLGYATIAASGIAKADAIRRRKFYPTKFEQGGMVEGPSHAEGGVPFTVQGRGGYEMEGGEFIVNKKAASMHRGLLEKINSSYRVPTSPSQYKFATGGVVTAKADESVDYLKAIAEATVSTAINSTKPVRAFVANKDLRNNATERRIRDRNDRL